MARVLDRRVRGNRRAWEMDRELAAGKIAKLEAAAAALEAEAERLEADNPDRPPDDWSVPEPFDERHADAVSVAWEMVQASGGRLTRRMVMEFAYRHVDDGRHFSRKRISIDHPSRAGRRVDLELDQLFSDRQRPSRIVQFKVDLEEWLERLSGLMRSAAELLALGVAPSSVAAELCVTLECCYRLRSKLRHDYQAFTGERIIRGKFRKR